VFVLERYIKSNLMFMSKARSLPTRGALEIETLRLGQNGEFVQANRLILRYLTRVEVT
jgi:hypothetical protein